MMADLHAPGLEHGQPVVAVHDLTIDFWAGGAYQTVVNRASFSIAAGESFGLVGESGSGKSTTVYALLGYHQPASRIRNGSVIFQGENLLSKREHDLQKLRGGRIGFVPQDPTTALTPNLRVGDLILESLRIHLGAERRAARHRMHELLRMVGLPQPQYTARKYPHQLSGGQQQRVAIAIALACNPALVVLDEPTTGLDVTTQAQILALLTRLRTELRLSIVYVSHDLSVIATICDRVGVMYAGELVEVASRRDVFARPRHPYTRALIAAVPHLTEPTGAIVRIPGVLQRASLPQGCKFAPRCTFAEEECFVAPQVLEPVSKGHLVACRRHTDPELQTITAHESALAATPRGTANGKSGSQKDETALVVRDLTCSYRRARGWLPWRQTAEVVVRGVSFSIVTGETFALVGESGSGKSTIAKAIAGIVPARSGEILVHSRSLPPDMRRRSRELLRQIQLIPQNPYASLNPRHRVATIIGRPLSVFFGLSRAPMRAKAVQLLDDVRLNGTYLGRTPRQLSGGERQRIAIARALAAEPSLLLCDEILSALDVSVQAGVRDVLGTLQKEHGMTYLFISHDLAVVRSLAHSVGVLYRGELCEIGRVDEVYKPPYHPYTYVLLSAVPDIDQQQPVSLIQPPADLQRTGKGSACPFAARCPWKLGAICEDEAPPWRHVSQTHQLRCHYTIPELLDRASTARPEGHAMRRRDNEA